MFDWNDEELANILWGEETDDHIVPYPEASEDLRNKNEWNKEASAAKLSEQKRPAAKIDIHGRKLGSSSNLENDRGLSASGFGANSWPELSLSNAPKADQGSLAAQDAGIFQNANEGKDQGDFVDYGWASTGTLDDLDRILSNDDPIFGHVNLDDADGLWPSSKEVSNNSSHLTLATANPAGALRNRFEPSEIKAEYVTRDDQSFSNTYKRSGDPASATIQNAHTVPVDEAYAGAGRKATGKEQQSLGQKNMLKARKKTYGKQDGKVLEDFYGNWSPLIDQPTQVENQVAPSIIQPSPSSVLAQQRQIEGTESLYQNINNSYVASPVYGNLTSTYAAMPIQSQVQSQDVRHHSLLPGYEVSPSVVNPVKSVDLVKPPTMTPQEKIEKLRRRQQMQAMIAIQKQRQQLGQQVPCSNKSITQKYPVEIQSHLCDGDDPEIEDPSILPALDRPIERDGSNTISLAVNGNFVEDAILYKLQDVICKMDIKMRLCVRDSLLRLAQSAMQRHHSCDKSSTDKTNREKFDVIAREDGYSQNRYARMFGVETETNPIDRTVAHLLFHGPSDLTGDLADKLDSPISARMQSTSKMANLANLSAGCLPEEDAKSNQQCSRQVFKNPCSMFEAQTMYQFKINPCVDTSKNASNNGPADVGAQVLEASH